MVREAERERGGGRGGEGVEVREGKRRFLHLCRLLKGSAMNSL